MPDRSNVIDLTTRRRPAKPEVIHVSTIARSDLPFVALVERGGYSLPVVLGYPADDGPLAG